MLVGSLTYSDKKSMLAAALRIQTYKIDDVSDTEVFYSTEDETTTFRGTYKRSYTIENNTVTLGVPVQVLKRTVYEPLVVVGTFSLDEPAEFSGDVVLRGGKVFEAGEYPDKDFSMTEEELSQTPVTFTPVINNLEHHPSILDGKLGALQSVTVKGKELFGKIAIPKWLHELHPDPIGLSLEWAKNTKRIVGCGLVLNPRITDAQAVAAFRAANACPDIVAATTTHGGAEMLKKPSWWDKLCALFHEGKLPEGFEEFDPDKVQFAEEGAPVIVPAAPPATPAADDQAANFSRIEAENAGLRAQAIGTAAVTFYEDGLKAGKCLPAERASLVAMFRQAVQDDNTGVACFDASGTLIEGDRVKALRGMIEARPKMNLTEELIPGQAELVVLSGGAPSGKMTDQRREELIDAGTIKVQKGTGG